MTNNGAQLQAHIEFEFYKMVLFAIKTGRKIQNMSEFSEKCKEYIRKSDTTIYQIAKSSGLERTMLQRMVNGNRLPDIEAVKKFCNYVQITKIEEEQLLELYKIEKIGKDTYYARQEVQDLLNGIQKMRRDWNQITYSRQKMLPADLNRDGMMIRSLRLDLEIMEAIQYVINKEIDRSETAHIDMDLFPRCEYAMQQLIREEKVAKNQIICNHYVNFLRGSCEGSAIENIRMLKMVVPFAFTFHHTYNVRYSYTTTERKDNFNRLWPHFLVTGSGMILFSENENRAVLIENQEIVRCCREEIEELSGKRRPLFENQEFGKSKFDVYFKKGVKNFPLWIYEGHMCVARMFYPELVEAEKNNPYVCMLVDSHNEHIYVEKQKPSVCIFSLGGLDEFMESGKLPGIYGQNSRVYTVSERKKMLEHYVESLSDDSLKSYLIKDTVYSIDSGMSVELYEGNRLRFISTSGEFPFGIVTINESNICNIFRDYFESLLKSGQVWDEEETKRRVRERIGLLRDGDD